jgi:RNA polymerase sigma-70 factor (ECF subfamily)
MLATTDDLFELAAAPRYMAFAARRRGAAAVVVATGSERLAEPEDENELMRRIGRADAAAYRIMANRHLAPVTGFAERMMGNRTEAEDVAQDTFLKLWTEAVRWTPRAKPSTWLYRIAHNLCIDRLRRRREDGADALDRQSAGDRPSALLERKETAIKVAQALARLPERQCAAITLVHYHGMASSEAAEVLEVSIEALESLLSRGRRSLREQLESFKQPEHGEHK